MNTLKFIVDKYNLDTDKKIIVEISNVGRSNLADWIHELDFKTGVEVGVANGYFSEILCKANPQMKLIGIDPWLPYAEYSDYKKQSTFNALENEAIEKLSKFTNYEFMKEMSMDAVKKFEDNSLDFVFIDANHKDPYITQDIEEWSKKVKSGGIVSGHDFVKIADVNWNVKDAVLRYVVKQNIKPLLVLGASARKTGTIRELHRSWMFVKK